ncbi:uncharacterized protein MICPUCDRAFT_66767 [Micromonas pusilla CCMP1545]|uniref:Predicted protein n=1 Tax=Micromonas pusilla (strain CCMP1545) TaxID=564608 RepID=C1N4I3_MICPC|nr:uncharacterized protein MICPUCDRAFT_66767 [Micromonas pusilla CCMP1545]EEH52735.1 predicted protein [Micromonas pusilla CCMP1545]|eukprot:XP_003062796.1 predicted protein [Micromonas pusilla CCMP1545]
MPRRQQQHRDLRYHQRGRHRPHRDDAHRAVLQRAVAFARDGWHEMEKVKRVVHQRPETDHRVIHQQRRLQRAGAEPRDDAADRGREQRRGVERHRGYLRHRERLLFVVADARRYDAFRRSRRHRSRRARDAVAVRRHPLPREEASRDAVERALRREQGRVAWRRDRLGAVLVQRDAAREDAHGGYHRRDDERREVGLHRALGGVALAARRRAEVHEPLHRVPSLAIPQEHVVRAHHRGVAVASARPSSRVAGVCVVWVKWVTPRFFFAYSYLDHAHHVVFGRSRSRSRFPHVQTVCKKINLTRGAQFLRMSFKPLSRSRPPINPTRASPN